MTDVNRPTRATSFGAAADDYARYRPAPPAEAAEWAVGASPGLVIDLAAGTGNLAGHLLRVADMVVAVDIDRRMLSALGERLTGVSRVEARGEELPFASGAAAAVVISSAWHWLDAERAWPEMARVIQPGGIFAVMWSGPDRTVSWVHEVLGTPPGDQPPGGVGGPPAGQRWRVQPPAGTPFSLTEARTFTAVVPYAVADLPGLAASYSRVMILPGAQRRAIRQEVAARAATRPELADQTMVDLPLRCRVWRAVRTRD
jgi:ubiquinone/menaquinone biosynthesis C-methylase UbiE